MFNVIFQFLWQHVVFLSGNEIMQVFFYSLFIYVLQLKIQLSLHLIFVYVPSQELDFQYHMSGSFLCPEVILRFVDSGGIVYTIQNTTNILLSIKTPQRAE